MTRTNLLGATALTLVSAIAIAAGCSSSSGTSSSSSSSGAGGSPSSSSSSSSSTSTSTSSSSTSTSSGFPAAPTIGTQIDRVGRPAVNAALTDTFDATGRGATLDTYNKDSTPSDWAAHWATPAYFEKNLAILDGLDGVCGNQLLYDFGTPDAGATTSSYSTLATVLADDQLYLNTAGTTMTQYLAVEANHLGLTNTDQGGRYLTYPVVDVSYSVLAAGALTGVTDGLSPDAPNNAVSTTFPYEAAPN